MKAVQIDRYGGPEVVSLCEIPIPKPGPKEVLIKVAAAGINSADWHIMRGNPFPLRLAMGWKKPSIKGMGADFSGVIAEVGSEVTSLKVGDAVFGDLSNCGFGAFAEWVAAPVSNVMIAPTSIPLERCAAVPMASVTALKGLKSIAQVLPGERVLVNGASGGVGSFAVQIAKILGAHVTAVCSGEKMEMFREVDIDGWIDYKKTNLRDVSLQFDVIFDAAAYQSPFSYEKLLRPKGRYVLVGGAFGPLLTVGLIGGVRNLFTSKKFMSYLSLPNQELLVEIRNWIQQGQLRPIIDQEYPMTAASNAMQRIDSRGVRGKILLRNDSF